jgi:hypothetical protein
VVIKLKIARREWQMKEIKIIIKEIMLLMIPNYLLHHYLFPFIQVKTFGTLIKDPQNT